MTREEAIKILKREVGCRRLPTCPDGVNLNASCKNCEYVTNYGDLTEAMEIAIKALEEPERIQCKDCVLTDGHEPIADGRYWCMLHGAYMHYCSAAERRTE